jgi:hypothetical protein
MKAVRASLTQKFIRVYKGFRHRKYGEPYPVDDKVNSKKEAGNYSDLSSEKDAEYPDDIKARAEVLQQ